jgi:hypothetical protein
MNVHFRYRMFSKFCAVSVIALLVGLFALPHVLRSQTTSTIEGTVTDKQGLGVSGVEVRVEGSTAAASRSVTTESNGAYQIPGLPAGTYKLTVTRDGFRTETFNDLEVTLNRTLNFDVQLQVGTTQERVEISAELPLLDTTSSSTGATIVPQEIENMPLNGRNYLDLLQLVPGVAINRQADANSDNATPILGERANNAGFLIDGLPNQNERFFNQVISR